MDLLIAFGEADLDDSGDAPLRMAIEIEELANQIIACPLVLTARHRNAQSE